MIVSVLSAMSASGSCARNGCAILFRRFGSTSNFIWLHKYTLHYSGPLRSCVLPIHQKTFILIRVFLAISREPFTYFVWLFICCCWPSRANVKIQFHDWKSWHSAVLLTSRPATLLHSHGEKLKGSLTEAWPGFDGNIALCLLLWYCLCSQLHWP